jgi:hypothetical protein
MGPHNIKRWNVSVSFPITKADDGKHMSFIGKRVRSL